jgi:hypothetical protein
MNRRVFLGSLAAPLLGAGAEPGFSSLFDGKTLRGWSVQQGPETAFFVQDGAIAVHPGSNYPAWLRSEKQYENFDLRFDFYLKGWMDSGLYLHAPEHGPPPEAGLKIKLFHKNESPKPESMGSVFPLVPPLRVNVNSNGQWNAMRVLMDWPRLNVWVNEEPVQDLNVESIPELRHRLRSGYLGLESLSYPIRFRNLQIKELPAKEQWQYLYRGPEDMRQWEVAEGKAQWETLGAVLRADGLGYLATRETYRDFELQTYVRASRFSNGGIIFRGPVSPSEAHYEIQLHDVEGAVYPTGSLYHHRRARYPRIAPEEWYLLQLIVKDKDCVVRINGETVVDYHALEFLNPAPIMLQAHQAGKWIEYKQIRVKRI